MCIKDLLDERNKALSNMDMEYARKIMPDASSDFVRTSAMHKARYDCTVINEKLRHESGDWLRAHGHDRMTGDKLLPIGELTI